MNMGWSKGQGLGKNLDGMTGIIQATRRQEKLGLGRDVRKEESYTDEWWMDIYSGAMNKDKAE